MSEATIIPGIRASVLNALRQRGAGAARSLIAGHQAMTRQDLARGHILPERAEPYLAALEALREEVDRLAGASPEP